MTTNWRMLRWGAGGMLLLLPLLAMQITGEVAWTAFDFAFAAVMIGGVLGLYELAAGRSATYRAGLVLALAAAFLLVWINGAVGIIGSENNPANLMFGAVLAVALGAAALARLRAPGMARAMRASAVVQILVGLVALAGGFGAADPSWPVELIGLTAAFATLWLASAWMFAREARE